MHSMGWMRRLERSCTEESLSRMSVGALAMNLSTVIVAVNAQFLRHFRP